MSRRGGLALKKWFSRCHKRFGFSVFANFSQLSRSSCKTRQVEKKLENRKRKRRYNTGDIRVAGGTHYSQAKKIRRIPMQLLWRCNFCERKVGISFLLMRNCFANVGCRIIWTILFNSRLKTCLTSSAMRCRVLQEKKVLARCKNCYCFSENTFSVFGRREMTRGCSQASAGSLFFWRVTFFFPNFAVSTWAHMISPRSYQIASNFIRLFYRRRTQARFKLYIPYINGTLDFRSNLSFCFWTMSWLYATATGLDIEVQSLLFYFFFSGRIMK